MRTLLVLSLVSLLLPAIAAARFTGPTATGQTNTVAQAQRARVDTYVTVTGNIVAHLREDYFTFRDDTGEIRVEIEPEVWRNRDIGANTTVRLLAEVDRNAAGTVYLWVQSFEIVK